jgi:hypothetical protein
VRSILLLMAVLVSGTAISQIKSGLVLSGTDRIPIPYVNIYSKSSSSGTVTNEEGKYRLTKEISDDSIIVSHIGFKRMAFKSSDFFLLTNDTILLQPSAIELKDIVIFGGEPKEVVKKAMKNITKNYPTSRNNIFAHFRNTIKENNEYVGFLEAAFLIQNQSYITGNDDPSKLQILDIHAAPNRSQFFTKITAQTEDIIGASDFFKTKPFLSKDINDYVFNLTEITPYDNFEIYVIKFQPKSGLKAKLLFSGTLYIETKSLIFVKLDYTIQFSDIPRFSFTKYKGLENEYHQTFNTKTITVLFKPFDGKWVLSYVNLVTSSKIVFTQRNKEINLELTQELLANKSELNSPKPLDKVKLINIKEDIIKQATALDASIWSTFNRLVPNEKMKALVDLKN